MQKIHMTKKHQEIKEGTATVWITTETEEEEISFQQYERIIDAAPFMRRLGGTETLQPQYIGGPIYRIISTSPNRMERKIYHFKFD